MSGLGKCSKIRHIVRLRQIIRRWRKKAAMSSRVSKYAGFSYIDGDNLSVRIPADVPAGHVAVCVGSSCTRFVVRATYLNHPVFRKLLLEAEEEYGFSNQGPLVIPCDEAMFEEILRFLSRNESNSSYCYYNFEELQRNCSVGSRNFEFWPDSRLLLHGLAGKSIV